MVAIVGGCSRGDDTLVFTSEGEFRDNMTRVRELSEPVFLKAERGETLLAEDRRALKESLKIFNGLYAYKPGLYTMPLAMGKAYQLLDDHDRAMDYFNAAATILEKAEGREEKLALAEVNYLAVDSLIRQRKFQDALAAAQEAVRLNDRSANYYAALAASHMQLNEADASRDALEMALKIDPTNRKALALAKLYAFGKAVR